MRRALESDQSVSAIATKPGDEHPYLDEIFGNRGILLDWQITPRSRFLKLIANGLDDLRVMDVIFERKLVGNQRFEGSSGGDRGRRGNMGAKPIYLRKPCGGSALCPDLSWDVCKKIARRKLTGKGTVAERVGFEPTKDCSLAVLKAAAINQALPPLPNKDSNITENASGNMVRVRAA